MSTNKNKQFISYIISLAILMVFSLIILLIQNKICKIVDEYRASFMALVSDHKSHTDIFSQLHGLMTQIQIRINYIHISAVGSLFCMLTSLIPVRSFLLLSKEEKFTVTSNPYSSLLFTEILVTYILGIMGIVDAYCASNNCRLIINIISQFIETLSEGQN